MRCPKYDACFDHTGTWTESKCRDDTCEFCAKRPNTPPCFTGTECDGHDPLGGPKCERS